MLHTEQYLLEHEGDYYDMNRVSLLGGSHGGFISAWLTTQKRDVDYVACIMRNPALYMDSTTGSDIPDWPYFENDIPYDFERPKVPSVEEVLLFRSKSPFSMIDGVKTKTLVNLGLKDKRCTPQQGMLWCQMLRSKGVPCKVMAFPDSGHTLDSVKAEEAEFSIYANFLLEALQEKE